jgi:hypothetical protein
MAVRRLMLIVVSLTALGWAACGFQDSSADPSPKSVTKLLVVVEENHALAQMRTGMPYAFGLARRFGYASSYRAIAHPSLPNYLAIAGGSDFGIRDDSSPSTHRIPGRSLFGEAVAHGRTAAVYAEGMPTPCATQNAGNYVVNHNPWPYFASERAACRRHDLGMGAFSSAVKGGHLPRIGMLVPDSCHDAHDCSLATADAWIRGAMRQVFAGPDWKSGHLVVVVTADEDDLSHGNKVLSVVIHPSQHHRVVTTRLNHYSLARLLAQVAHIPPPRQAASAPSIAGAFHLNVG